MPYFCRRNAKRPSSNPPYFPAKNLPNRFFHQKFLLMSKFKFFAHSPRTALLLACVFLLTLNLIMSCRDDAAELREPQTPGDRAVTLRAPCGEPTFATALLRRMKMLRLICAGTFPSLLPVAILVVTPQQMSEFQVHLLHLKHETFASQSLLTCVSTTQVRRTRWQFGYLLVAVHHK